MRRDILPLFCALSLGCGDDTAPSADSDTSAPDTTSDTSPDTTAPDTTSGDTTAPDTRPADTTPDTTPADTSAPDVAPDPAEGICPGIVGCSQLCSTESCATSCVADADTALEGTLATAYLSCLETNNCEVSEFATPEESKAALECERSNCLGAKVDCMSGDTFGSATCTVTAGCLKDCEEGDLLCQRACLSAASESAVNAHFDFSLCVARECFGNASFQTCSQQASSSLGPCSTVYNACFGDTGAAPGAGGGGGLPR